MRGLPFLLIIPSLMLTAAGACAATQTPPAGPASVLAPASGQAVATPAAMTTLAPFSASYEVRLNNLPFRATARQSLAPMGGDRWRLMITIKSFLLDTNEFSEFRWDGQNCHTIPERYGYSRNGIGRDQKLDMRFDFNTRTLTRHDGKSAKAIAIGAGVEDKLGHTLAVACRVARGARGVLGVDVAWDNDVRHFGYVVSKAEETIDTPLATWRAVRVERQRADDDRITTTWLAAAAGWNTVKMQHSEGDGRLFQLQLLEMDRAK